MTRSSLHQRARETQGQTLLLFTVFVVVLILFVGLAVDFGFAYITKAQLSKAVDAAALAGVRSLALGDTQCRNIASSAFAMNYGRPARDVGAVTPAVAIVTNPTTGQRRMQVSAATTINTFFIGILPAFRTLTVSASAEALRGRLIMSVILDRSTSMSLNGGWSALPPAVDSFINLFDDNVDRAALITYATTVRVDFAMGQPFKAQIRAVVPRDRSQYDGYTFSHGGLTAGHTEIRNTPAPPSENPIRVAVFFTDGLANAMQETVAANCALPQPLTLSGSDSGSTYYVLNIPTPPETDTYCTATGPGPSCCPGFTSFVSVNGPARTPTAATIRQEGKDRALAEAQSMQGDGIVVYAIGLGNNVDATFLRRVANDPSSPFYNSTLPSGKALIAPAARDLENVFKVIAADILSRLTR